MFKIKSFGFIIILFILNWSIKAQTSGNGLREANKHHKIAIKDIIGDWYATDSLKSKISFVIDGNYFVHIEGIKHGVENYGFIIDKDSMFVNGTAANWPPYDCTLKLLNLNVLEISFYQYFYRETTNVILKR